MKNASKKIVAIRVQNGLSQAGFGKSLGYSKGYIANIETGRTKPSRKFLEALSREYKTSIDWLFQDTRILDLIEENKQTKNPNIIFVYAFTQEGIDEAERDLQLLLEGRNYILVDATGVKSVYRFYRKIVNEEGNTYHLHKKLENMMLNEDVVLIIKNLSLSKIPGSGDYVRSIFKIMDDAWDREGAREKGGPLKHLIPPSSLILLDFPSYLEKNMNTFGYYAIPIYGLAPTFGYKK